MWIKSQCRLCFLDIRTGTFKRICVWFTQNFQVWSKYLLPCAFWVNYSNKRRVMMRRLFEGGVYLYFSSKLRCLVGAAFNRIITVCSEIWNLPDILLETGIKYNTRWRQMWTLWLKIFRTQRKDMEWWILASLRRRVETLDRGLSWKILSVCLKVLCNINLKIYSCLLSSNSQKN